MEGVCVRAQVRRHYPHVMRRPKHSKNSQRAGLVVQAIANLLGSWRVPSEGRAGISYGQPYKSSNREETVMIMLSGDRPELFQGFSNARIQIMGRAGVRHVAPRLA